MSLEEIGRETLQEGYTNARSLAELVSEGEYKRKWWASTRAERYGDVDTEHASELLEERSDGALSCDRVMDGMSNRRSTCD